MSDILSLFDTARTHHHQLWTMYIVIVLGVLGFSFSETYAKCDGTSRALLSSAYIVFALGHIFSLIGNYHFHNAIVGQFSNLNPPVVQGFDFQVVLSKISKNLIWPEVAGHIALDLAVVYSMWRGFKRKTKTE